MKPIRRIVIVGGGTSAWLTAAFLLNKTRKYCEIVVIDKEQGQTVGVGEATILSFKSFMEACGFPVESWFNEIDATFKSGILFANWQKEGEDIWHPFAFPAYDWANTNLLNIWTQYKDLDFKLNATALYHPSVDENKVDPTNLPAYAYHIDCGKLVKFIQNKIMDKITFVESEVVDIVRDSIGNVQHLLLSDGQEIESDLFVDCTGFKRLIGSKPDTVNLRDRLFCDTAVAGHIPYNDIENEMRPYVICDAVEHGWIWNIPVQTRIGSGLVFNRSITDPEEAKDYFVKYWDNRVERESLKVIDWTPYYHNNFWENNVVCIGLSAGFIEPLESTGVALICAGAIGLGEALKGSSYNMQDINLYNCKMKCFFENAVDFVNMHYSRSQKSGKFWEWVKETHQMTDTQKYYEFELEHNPYQVPNDGDFMFAGENWSVWLFQLMNVENILYKNNGLSETQTKQIISDFRKNELEKHKNSVLHYEYVKNYLNKCNEYKNNR
jgi:tryptophan halogenase